MRELEVPFHYHPDAVGGTEVCTAPITRETMTSSDSRLCRLLYAFVLCIYLLTARGCVQEVDSWASLQTAEAIVRHATLAIAAAPGGLTLAHAGHNFSRYGIGAAVVLLPFVGLSDAVGAVIGWDRDYWAGVLESFHSAFFAAAACVLLFRICRLLGGTRRASLTTSLVLGFATLCWAYGVRDYSEAVQLSLMLGTVYGLVKGPGRDTYIAGACFSGLLLVKAASLVYLPIFLAYVFVSSGYGVRAVCRFAAPVLVAMTVLAVLNFARFGNILEFGYGAEGRMFSAAGLPANLVRLLISPSFGLFVYSPALVLGAVLFPSFVRSRPREAVFFALLLAANLFLNATWHDVAGGHSWGPRLLVPTIGLWLVPFAMGLHHLRTGARALAGALAVVSLVILLGGVFETVRPSARPRRSVTAGPAAVILVNKVMNKVETLRVDRYPLSLWYVRVADRLGHPQLAWLALLGFVVAAVPAVRLWQEIQRYEPALDVPNPGPR